VHDSSLEHFFGPKMMVPFQNPAVRWRSLYFRVFDFTFVLMLLASCGAVWQAWYAKPRRYFSLIPIVFAWLSVGGLLFFYAKSPSVASRYLVDFLPAFFMLMLVLWVECLEVCTQSLHGYHRGVRYWYSILCVVIVFGGWFGYETWKGPLQLHQSKAWYPVRNNFDQSVDLYHKLTPPTLPRAYSIGEKTIASNLPFNGTGWDPLTGAVQEVLIFYLLSPAKPLVLTLKPEGFKTDADALTYAHTIEAKVGIETLKLASVVEKKGKIIVTFSPPQSPHYREGVQTAFFRFPFLFKDTSRKPDVLLERLGSE
jgi:hypothetical protein